MHRLIVLTGIGLIACGGILPTASSGSGYALLNESMPAEAGAAAQLVSAPPAGQSIDVAGSAEVGTSCDFVPNEILVKFTPSFKQELDQARGKGISGVSFLSGSIPALADAQVVEVSALFAPTHALSAIHRVTVADGTDILQLCRALASDTSKIVYAEPNFIARLEMVPNDPYYFSSGTWGQEYADMWGAHAVNLEEAWDVTQGAGVVVALIDTGIDYTHVDLYFDENDNGQLDPGEQYNVWVNPGEDLNGNGVIDTEEVNGLDDDENGFADDFYGWDFGESESDPMDVYGHGTYCAGIIAAVGNNEIGMIGVAPQAKAMAVKCFDDSGTASADQLAAGMAYAADSGARVLSNSWTIARNDTTADAITYAQSQGCVVVAAAGNYAVNAAFYLPAGAPGVLTVGAVDSDLAYGASSDYGSTVDVCAPGVDILSLRAAGTDIYDDGEHFVPPDDPNAEYYRGDGTSASCAFTAGVSALLLAADPALSATQVRRIVTESTSPVSSPDYYIGTGLIDATAALALVGTVSGVEAGFTQPENDLEVTTTQVPLEIWGSAEGASYVLEYGEGYHPDEWSTISTGGYVSDGLLGTLAFTYESGPLHIRLTVDDGTLTAVERTVLYAEPALHPGWPVYLGGQVINFGGFILSSAYTSTPYDADNDGADEIFINSAGYTFGLRGDATHLPGWPTEQASYISYGSNYGMPGPSGADFDGDGEGEVLWTLRDWYAGSVTVWSFNARNFDGSDVPGFPQHAPGMTWNSNAFEIPFVVADLDDDGDLEAVAAHTLGNNGYFYRLSAFDHMGNRLFTHDMESTTETIVSVCFGDIDGDGQKEIVAVSRAAYQNADVDLHIFDADGNEWPGYPTYLYHMSGTDTVIAGSPSFLADLDDDGDLEVLLGISGSQGKVRAYHHDGTAVTGWPIQIGDSNQLFDFCLGDVTGDGVYELIALVNYRLVSGLYRAYAIDIASGTTLPGWPYDLYGVNRGVPAVVDVDNDGLQDVCFVAEDGQLHAVAGNGQSVLGFPKRMSYGSRSGVSVGDVDGDNLFELITTSIAGAAYVWDLPTPALPTRTDWPMRHVNPQNTGVFSGPGCTEAGVVALDRPKYACEGTANIEVVDCGLNTDDNVVEYVTVDIDSDSETGVEQVTFD